MLSYFEKQLREINDSIHSIDEIEFTRLVKEASEVLATGYKVIVSGLGKNVPICEKFVVLWFPLGWMPVFYIPIRPYMGIWEL